MESSLRRAIPRTTFNFSEAIGRNDQQQGVFAKAVLPKEKMECVSDGSPWG